MERTQGENFWAMCHVSWERNLFSVDLLSAKLGGGHLHLCHSGSWGALSVCEHGCQSRDTT